MELIPSETSLVVAGSWNAAILTPGWVMQHGLNRVPGEPGQVKVFLPAVQGAMFEFARYTFEEFSYVVRPDALLILPSAATPDKFGEAETATARILGVLSHTPIMGIGHNFEFREAVPTPEEVAVFTDSRRDLVDKVPGDWVPAGVTIAATFKNQAETVQVNIQRLWDGGSMVIKFNFHHAVTSIDQAIAVLQGADGYSRMAGNLELANQLVVSLYGEAKNDQS